MTRAFWPSFLAIAACRPTESLPDAPTIDLSHGPTALVEGVDDLRHVVELTGGEVVFVDRYNNRIGFVNATTGAVRYFGRDGNGPGEFRRPDGVVRLPGDSIGVPDGIAYKFSVFDSSGRFARAAPMLDPPEASFWNECQFFSDSLGNVYSIPTDGRSLREVESEIDTFPVIRFKPGVAGQETIWSIAALALRWYPMRSGTVASRQPLTAPLVAGVTPGGTIVATSFDAQHILRRTPDGRVDVSPEIGLPEPPVTKAQRDSANSWFNSKQTYSGTQLTFPAKRGPFDQGLVLRSGDLLVRVPWRNRERTAYAWISAGGAIRAFIALPYGSTVVAAGEERIYFTMVGNSGGLDLYRSATIRLSIATIPHPAESRKVN